jgi:hypothetical protein
MMKRGAGMVRMRIGHRFPRCQYSGKVRFRYRKDAIDFVVGARYRAERCAAEGVPCRRRETRAYKCENCGGWHVTSAAYKEPEVWSTIP